MLSMPRNRADITQDPDRPRMRLRRYWWILAIIVVAILAEVLIYYPTKTTLSEKQTDFKSIVTEMQTDVGGCAVGLPNAYDVMSRIHGGDTSNLKIASTIVTEDESDCTIAVNSDLYDMATLVPPTDLERYNLSPIVQEAYAWAYPGATAVLYDLNALLTHPDNVSDLTDMKSHLTTMRVTIERTNEALARISQELDMSPQTLNLSGYKGMPTYLRNELSKV